MCEVRPCSLERDLHAYGRAAEKDSGNVGFHHMVRKSVVATSSTYMIVLVV